jgi:DNA-directed RNA polymerase subunit RPC12/RpoP
MTRILRRQKCAYALSLILCLLGLAAMFAALRITWSEVSSAENPTSVFWTLLWREQLDFIPGVKFKLAYLTILGAVMIVSGLVIWALSRQSFYLPEETVLFQCPFCKNKWRASRDKGLVQCPHCSHLVHPKMIEK